MDDVLDDMVRMARRCERAARTLEVDDVDQLRRALLNASQDVGRASSGSWIGYQATVYLRDLRPRAPGDHFDSEWGSIGVFSNQSRGDWCEYSYDAIHAGILQRAKASDSALEHLAQLADAAEEVFEDCRTEVLPTLDALLNTREDNVIRDARQTIAEMLSHFAALEIAHEMGPKGGQFVVRDPRAQQGQFQAPHHVNFECRIISYFTRATQLNELAKQIRHCVRYLQQTQKMKGKTVAKKDGKVFIGHGRSAAWRDLKDFIQDRLGLQWDEFNREPSAGLSTKERLESMLDDACFAFLVMTAEDAHEDGSYHARENVVHEVGLFQGRLGFERAIVLLEERCSEFSNIGGLAQIRFPKGNIMALSEEIRRVLEREKIL